MRGSLRKGNEMLMPPGSTGMGAWTLAFSPVMWKQEPAESGNGSVQPPPFLRPKKGLPGWHSVPRTCSHPVMPRSPLAWQLLWVLTTMGTHPLSSVLDQVLPEHSQ